MNKTFKVTYVFALALVLSIFSCNNDDEQTVIPEIIVEVNVQNLTVAIDENPTNGQSVGTVETDGDGTLNFSITSQTPTGALSVNTSTGEVTVADATMFDFETNPTITATVSVDGAANTSAVTINLNDLDEISTQDLTVAIDENPIDGQVVGSIQVDGGGTLSFSITSQAPAGALAINTSTGELTVVDPNLFDFETNPVLTATISVDNSVNISTAIATINLVDLDEVSAENLTAAIDENPTNGDVVGAIQATGGNLTFTITFQNPAGAFNINASTGELTVADAALFDFETNANMLATVSVENSVNMVSVNANIGLNDLHEVGEFKYGGIIFSVNATGDEGLVFALNDQTNNIPWGCNNSITGATATAIGAGETNTATIVSFGCAPQGSPVEVISNLTLNGYDDWFLPSNNELAEIYSNSNIVFPALVANGGTAPASWYYSSSELNATSVRIVNFTSGNSSAGGPKASGTYQARAVRAFTDF